MTERILSLRAADGYGILLKLSEPEKKGRKAVVFVNGSGPNTYDNKRQLPDGTLFSYFDLFASQFTNRKIAFCRYSTRGVFPGEQPPLFAEINEKEYQTYLPHTSVSDIEAIVLYLNRIGYDKIFLLGWSEGSILAPLVVRNEAVKIDALLLAGYCNENLKKILTWQLTGNASLIFYRRLFDYHRRGYISREDFEEDRFHVRDQLFGGHSFAEIDLDHDGILTEKDFAPASIEHLNAMLRAIESNDDEWLKNNHSVRLTSAWFKEHFSLKPNKKILPRLNLPIHIFSGEYDMMTPSFYADDIESEFAKRGKTNLTVHRFQNHDHDLNYMHYIVYGKISEGIMAILNTAAAL
ncbi:MAG TPA: hypothetical protein IAD50_03860 [Candidatus Egerieisoma faecipullorum]|uniref:Uncharacterized protein n=1 Tax=Candidatus Egerieisoma faecipullorum TaxID=2840963 RepID=A0A9D1I9G1_9CLOT|nr:hypothetical protein [Candidatus Egerieisoma faecipullorum]